MNKFVKPKNGNIFPYVERINIEAKKTVLEDGRRGFLLESAPTYAAPLRNNLREILEEKAKKIPNNYAYAYRTGKERRTEHRTYKELYEDILSLGEALLNNQNYTRLYVEEEQTSPIDQNKLLKLATTVGIIGNNSYPWVVSYAANIFGLATLCPLDKDLKLEECLGICNRAGISILFFGSDHVDLALNLAKRCPTIKMIVAMPKSSYREALEIVDSNIDEIDNCQYLVTDDKKIEIKQFSDLLKTGYELRKSGENKFSSLEIKSDALASIFFTSGTTDKSKGVMLSHKNICSDLNSGLSVIAPWGLKSCLSVLPLHHSFEHTVGMLALWEMEMEICINDGLKYVPQNLKEWGVEAIFMVPLFLENFYRKLNHELKRQKKDKLFYKMLNISNFLRKFGVDLRTPLFKKVRDGISPSLQTFFVGGAALDTSLYKFFVDIGYDVWQAYGLTEASPGVSAGNQDYFCIGTVGILCPPMKAFIETDANSEGPDSAGELCVKGDNIMIGYFRDKEASKQAIDSLGYLHTGDIAYFDSGRIILKGREKSMIVLENGKNVFPEEIEEIIKKFNFCENVMVFALPNSKGHSEIGVEIQVNSQFLDNLESNLAYYDAKILELNSHLPKYKQIKSYIWTSESMIMTTTRKIKRNEELKKIKQFLDKNGLRLKEANALRID